MKRHSVHSTVAIYFNFSHCLLMNSNSPRWVLKTYVWGVLEFVSPTLFGGPKYILHPVVKGLSLNRILPWFVYSFFISLTLIFIMFSHMVG
ncbi:hypothetical protein GDO86_006895 [Hymenochirus boettgeri]|uniref:Uncharacterized protein n=1 Tax=Hymenochirus boettgeri TaxID=247094 RepID=A0A8T2JAF8_9PIPI|nr:hypothetical protein GDO86_006893 [Hymenochirus boettgeri]KAG8441332.1 hypothetical protein GDO86_006895 [Hymenochirus boettgeri]